MTKTSLSTRAARIARAAFGASVLSLSGAAFAQATPAASPSAPDVAAGKYLAAAAHCGACHTSRVDRPYAGNLAIPSKFGTMYSSNITPDAATGIGRWTLQQFDAALRLGKGSHGEYLYPAMPYTDFTKIGDADVAALFAYFRSLTPIAEKTKKNEMKFPFNIRLGIGAWQAAYFRPRRFVADPSQTAEWNRGAYLVDGLGHCGACHTPRNLAMAEKKGRDLQGAETGDHWFAPDISGGRWSGIRDWSVEQVANYLKTGHNSKNVAAVGPMLQTIAQGTSELTAADLRAMAVYLKGQGAPEREGARPQSVALEPDRRAAGLAVYEVQCMSCHGPDGKGADGIAPALAGNSSVTSQGPETVMHAVVQGFAPAGRWGPMPSFAQALDDQEIADVANYVRNAWGQTASANATAYRVNRMRSEVQPGREPVQQALVCPAVPAGSIDPATQAEIGRLAAAPRGDTPPPRLLAGYRQRHPGVDAPTAVNLLSGAFCRGVMQANAGSHVERQSRFINFMARLAAQGAR